jgi:hypothetical protein
MPDLLLRRNAVVATYPDEFTVILTMDDGYELAVGGIRKDTGVGLREFWAWSGPDANGQAETREAAMAAVKNRWRATDEELAAMRRQQEWTANKYALWDAGYRDQVRRGVINCPCGETFDPKSHEATMAHISHITGRPPGTNPPPRA